MWAEGGCPSAATAAKRSRPKVSPLQAFHVGRCRHHRQPRSKGVGPPTNVVRHDGRRSYLVVAGRQRAPRHSPNIANGISEEARLLAFPWGGSLPSRRFRRLRPQGHWATPPWSLRIGQAPFRRDGHRTHHPPRSQPTVGVGDMSGTLFATGMLRENHDEDARRVRSRDSSSTQPRSEGKGLAERKAACSRLPRSKLAGTNDNGH